MTAEEIQALVAMSDDERVQWLSARSTVLSESDVRTLRSFGLGGQFAVELVNLLDGDSVIGEATDAARPLIDEVGRGMDEMARDAANRANSELVPQAQAAGSPGGVEITPEEADEIARNGGTPGQFTITAKEAEFIQMFGGTVQAAERRLQWMNEQYGWDFESIGEIVDSPQWEDAIFRREAETIFGGEEPKQAWEFALPGGDIMTLDLDTVARAQQVFNIQDPEDIGHFARLAKYNDMYTSLGELNWQTMAALETWSGRSVASQNRYREGQQKLIDERSENNERMADLRERLGTAHSRLKPGIEAELERLADRNLEINAEINASKDPRRAIGPSQMADRYREGMGLYDSETLAFFHVVDEGLAARLRAGTATSKADMRAILGHLQKAGLKGEDVASYAENMFDLGFTDPFAAAVADAASRGGGGGGGGGGGRMMPDPVALRQATKDMYRQMYMEEPDEATLDSLTASVTSAIVGAPGNESVSPEARLREAVESDPKYAEYYGNKPGGMTEEEYQGMFIAGQQSMLGAEAAGNTAARVGMKSGQYQTAVGATLGLKESWDNSTFLGRLANAADTVGKNT